MTEVQAQELLVLMATAWPDGQRFLDKDQQAETRRLYRTFLLDLDYRHADIAVRRLIALSVKFPMIAELRRAIVTQQHGRQPIAGEAWGVVKKLCSPRTEEQWLAVDELLRRCCEAMGWIVRDKVWHGGVEETRYRLELGDNESSDRARFSVMYDQLSQRDVSDRVVGSLAPPIPVRQLAAPTVERVGVIVARLLPKKATE